MTKQQHTEGQHVGPLREQEAGGIARETSRRSGIPGSVLHWRKSKHGGRWWVQGTQRMREQEAKSASCRNPSRYRCTEGPTIGHTVELAVRCEIVGQLIVHHSTSKDRVHRLPGVSHPVAQYCCKQRSDAALRARLKELAARCRCYSSLCLQTPLVKENHATTTKRTNRLSREEVVQVRGRRCRCL